MSETAVASQSAASTEEKKPVAGNIISRGAATIATISAPAVKTEDTAAAAADPNETPEAKALREAAELEAKNKGPQVTDDELKALLKEKGIELDDKGFEGLKEKLQPAHAAKDPAEIQKEKVAAEAAFEKRMLDFYIANGGTAESFVAFKQVAAADLKDLSESEIRRELRDAKFTDDEINAVILERYYQLNPDELVRDEDTETEEQFAAKKALIAKKIAYGSSKKESKASHIKKQAEDALSTLRNQIKLQDDQKAKEVEDSKRVEDFFAKAPKKMTFTLGKAENGQEIPPVEIDIPDAVIAEVQDTLKDPAKRNNFLYNQDNSLNLDNVANVMIRNKILEAALAKATIDGEDRGSTREVEKFEKLFPGRTAKDVGVGGGSGGSNGQGRKGVIASKGKPEVVRR